MTTPTKDPHPSAGTLAAHLEGTLPADESRTVRDHLIECRDCREVALETAELLETADEDDIAGSGTGPLPSSQWQWLAAAAAVLLIAAAAVFFARRPEPQPTPMSLLADASPAERSLEVRLSDMEWKPLRRELRGSGDEHSLALLAAAARIREIAESDPTSANLHTLARAYLILGEPSKALAELERGAALEQPTDQARVDHAAALIAAGERTADPQSCARALDVLAGIGSEDVRAAAVFNEALALECVGLLDSARSTWLRYLEIDSSTDWSVEARSHIESIDREQEEAGEPTGSEALIDRATDELLPRWAEAVLQHDDTLAGETLIEIREIAVQTKDDILMTTVEMLRQSDAPALRSAAEAHHSFGVARQRYREGRVTEAIEHAGSAERRLSSLGSPFMPYVSLLIASCSYYEGNVPETSALLDPVRLSMRAPILEGRIRWLRGLTHHSGEELQLAAREYEHARDLFAANGAPESEILMLSYLAMARFQAGRPLEGWRSLSAATRRDHILPPARRYSLREIMSRTAARSGLVTVAGHAASSALEAARISGRSDLIAGALGLPIMHERDGSAIVELRAAVEDIPDDAVRSRAVNVTNVWLARSVAESDPRAAEEAATRAIRDLSGTGASDLLAEAHLARGIARSRLSRPSRAIEDLALALELTETRQKDSPAEIDVLLARETQSLAWREWVDILWDTGRKDDALDIVLRARRAATLRQNGTGESTARLVIWPGRSRALVWIESANGARSLELDLGEERARRISEQISEPASGSDLDLLLRPLSPIAAAVVDGGNRTLSILASSPFDKLPWAALRTPDGQYLVNAVTIHLTLGDSEEPSPCMQRHLVGAIGTGITPDDLPRLRFVDDELALIKSIYDDESAPRCGVLHYAGHARTGELRNELFFGDGAIVPSELARRWPHEIAILSACSTGTGSPLTISGSLSHARDLIDAGTSSVIATLWPVVDGEGLDLLEDLHRRLASGAPTNEALASAQRNAITLGAPARMWASWINLTT